MSKYLLENTRPRPFTIGKVQLLMGINEITKDQWEKIKGHPATKESFESGNLKWVVGSSPDQAPKGKEPSQEYPLKKMTPKEASSVIKGTVSIPVLDGWLRLETRKEVTAAILAQLEKIKVAEVDKDDDSKKGGK